MSVVPGRKVVLLVDDDEETSAIYRAVILEAGYEVLTARHGAEGVHLARRHRPDLILMDLLMPVMDGWCAAWYMKTDPFTAEIPICGISGYVPEEEVREHPHASHFDCIVLKPSDPRSVVTTIQAMIGLPIREPED